MSPKFTIVTVVFNGEKVIEKTILSVINQTYKNFEYIIIDGGSTDDTLSIIKNYNHQINLWISEKDKGIYDAMNKGVDLSSGQIVQFLNAGDLFFNSEVLNSVAFYLENRSADIFAFGFSIENNIHYPYLNFTSLLKGMPCHQALFYNVTFLKRNPFNIYFKYCSDYHNLVNAIFSNVVLTFNYTVVLYDNNGISSNIKVQNKIRFERFMAAYKSSLPFHWKFSFMFYNLIRIVI